MATRRTTHGKRERERSRQLKAAAKRDRREGRATSEAGEEAPVALDDGDATTEELLARIEALHASYDAGEISFEDFDTERAELTDRIALRLSQ
jgi:hypothetical protein